MNQKVVLQEAALRGAVQPPPSKSDAHRAIICAALAKGKSTLSPIDLSKDIEATIAAVKALGATVLLDGSTLHVDGSTMFSQNGVVVDCFESGSTLRFMLSVAAVGGKACTFTGHGRLPERPITELLALLGQNGVSFSSPSLPLSLSGQLCSGRFELAGNVSSQYITSLLLALPLCQGDSQIVLTTPLESVGYVDLTIAVMQRFGVSAEKTDYGYFVKGSQVYKACNYTVEADWSQSAFFAVAGAIGGNVELHGMELASVQGDKEVLKILERMGASIEYSASTVLVKSSKLHGTVIDARQIPDLVPALAVAAAFAEGKTTFINAERLRIKESDRIASTAAALQGIGIKVDVNSSGMTVHGGVPHFVREIDGCNDHRIVMAFAVAALATKGGAVINDAMSIEKSYPNFFEEYNRLGGKANVVNLG